MKKGLKFQKKGIVFFLKRKFVSHLALSSKSKENLLSLELWLDIGIKLKIGQENKL